jgi:FtsZ-interacting cell division protein ZipA
MWTKPCASQPYERSELRAAMSWLRPILLLVSAVIVGAIIWLERRRPKRVQVDESAHGERTGGEWPARADLYDGSGRHALSERSDPSIELEAEGESAANASWSAPASARGPDPGRALPVIDWSTAVGSAPGEPQLIMIDEPGAPSPGAVRASAEPVAVAAPEAAAETAPPSTSLVVDWPAEAQRQIASLRVVAARQNRIAGRALRQGLAAAGFRHGQMGIFHLGHSDGRVILSAASLVRPGVLDPESMDFQSFSGVNLFAVLPGPLESTLTLERLTSVAADLAQRVEGRVQDERGAPFDCAHPGSWRERMLAGAQAGGPTH